MTNILVSHIDYMEIIYQIYIVSKNRLSFLKKKKKIMTGFEHGALALQACLLTAVPREYL